MHSNRKRAFCFDVDHLEHQMDCPRLKSKVKQILPTCCGQCDYPCPARCMVDLKHRFGDQEPWCSPQPDFKHRKRKDWCLAANELMKNNTDFPHQDYSAIPDPTKKPDPLTGEVAYLPDTAICEYCKVFKVKDRRYIHEKVDSTL